LSWELFPDCDSDLGGNTINADIEGVFKQDAAETSALVEMLTGVATVKAAAAEQTFAGDGNLFTSTLNTQFRGQNSVTDWT